MTHTKGPWRVGYAAFTVEAGGMKICDIRGWGYLTGTGSLNLPPEKAKAIQEANARLISAAPELLDAARRAYLNLLSIESRNEHQQKALDELGAAISKATGGDENG